jgi:peptidylprolyl isomerase
MENTMKFLLPLLIALSTLVFADLHDTLSKTDKVKTEYPVAVLETTQGTIEIELRPDYAPLAVENFSTHIKDGYYNGLIFHRIIKNFMIQGGDPTGTGRGGKSIWDKPFTTAPTPWLNGRHTIFGYVVKGMDVIQKLNEIETTGRSGGDRPLEEQKIVKAYIK